MKQRCIKYEQWKHAHIYNAYQEKQFKTQINEKHKKWKAKRNHMGQ